ncbi:MAG: carbamoyltransferase HypF [Deltaproteobacteria bacterium]|nr:carbamoyltransferase HypF [Deltaproteobacteria bacterium]
MRRRFEVAGIVQGVGFRPFVYRLATRLGLGGHVFNHEAGVTIEVEGDAAAVDAFAAALRPEAPPLSRIDEVRAVDVADAGERAFRIAPSAAHARAATLISPDVAVCDDCRRELFDPADRRHRYPFINCVNCGPRYTIIADLPYDRPKTTMRAFTMCPACQAEYDDPRTRRFHAQPNACPACGPRLALEDAAGRPLPAADPVAAAVARLVAGAILAVKGLGGFHLACDAALAAVVAELRRRKHRDEKPFAVMVRDLEAVAALAAVSDAEARLLTSPERPIVLLARRAGGPSCDEVAPGNRRVGVMLPYTPLHHLLLADAGGFPGPLVMTSANPSDEPIVRDNDEARWRLRGIADAFLVHDRDILVRADDSVLHVAAGMPRQVRRSRGFVPVPVRLPRGGPPVLAVGGELKNTICLTRGRDAFLSQHIGDLENAPTAAFLEEIAAHLQRVLDLRPEVVVHDLHPDYHATRYALHRTDLTRLAVQHHHAHVLACLAEHGREAPCIGLALDGTGYGLDDTIWGGEVLVVDGTAMQRAAHFRALPLPGGEQAIREPWRMALALLHVAGAADRLEQLLPRWPHAEARTARTLRDLLARAHPFPRSSGLGRLFDAVAALLGIRDLATFEGQAAMALEQAAAWDPAVPPYPIDLVPAAPGGTPLVVDPAAMARALLDDLDAGATPARAAARFHATIVATLVTLAQRTRADTSLRLVALGGGVFQNRILLETISARLTADGFEVLAPAQVPANDGGLALGQAYFALLSLG